ALAAVAVSIGEEIAFRGALYAALEDLGGAPAAVVGSTLLWTLAHALSHPPAFLGAIAAAGLLLALWRWACRDLVGPIAGVVIGVLPGTFGSAGTTTISVDIVPLDSCPKPPGISFVTNVYKITASAPPAKGKTAGLTLRYSNLEPDPSDVYQASDPAGPWKSIGRNEQAAPFTVDTRVDSFGYFAAGYPTASPPPGSVTLGGGQTLPIIVAVLIVVVVLAGLPLAIVRRRQRSTPADEEEKG